MPVQIDAKSELEYLDASAVTRMQYLDIMSDKTNAKGKSTLRDRVAALLEEEDVAVFAVVTIGEDGRVGSMWSDHPDVFKLIGVTQSLVFKLADTIEKRKD